MSFDYSSALESVLDESVAPRAAETDERGEFPRDGVAALGEAGFLGLISSTEVGGLGEGLGAAAHVIERIAGTCGSTAMVVLMHYAATAAFEAHGPARTRRAIASGRHLTTLALSEPGSRSQFWVSTGIAKSSGRETVELEGDKSWITAAAEADSYVWSTRPLGDGGGGTTLWEVPSSAPGLRITGGFDGFGLRGNGSTPVSASGVEVPDEAMLGADGSGLEVAFESVLPYFLVLNAALSLGITEAVLSEAAAHLKRTTLQHLGETLAEQPGHRDRFAQLRTRADQVRTLLHDTVAAVESGRSDATVRVLQSKLVAAEAAAEVADGVLRLCGGAAFRKEFGVERRFRDSLAARVMAPTTEALQDFVGKASLGQSLFA